MPGSRPPTTSRAPPTRCSRGRTERSGRSWSRTAVRTDAASRRRSRTPAGKLGLGVVGTTRWSARQRTYRALAERVRAPRPDTVFIAGDIAATGRSWSPISRRAWARRPADGRRLVQQPESIVEAAGAGAEDWSSASPCSRTATCRPRAGSRRRVHEAVLAAPVLLLGPRRTGARCCSTRSRAPAAIARGWRRRS